jgi:TFIIH basal transcription factor complex TTD-A subunit
MAQFIVNLNASMPASERFIVHMLDPTHMFVQPHVAEMIRSKIGGSSGTRTAMRSHSEGSSHLTICIVSLPPKAGYLALISAGTAIQWLLGWHCHASPMMI